MLAHRGLRVETSRELRGGAEVLRALLPNGHSRIPAIKPSSKAIHSRLRLRRL